MVCQLFQAERQFTLHYINIDRTGNGTELHVHVGRGGRPRGGGAIVLDSREEQSEDGGFEVGEGGPRGAGSPGGVAPGGRGPWGAGPLGGGGEILVRCSFFLCDRKGGNGGRRLEQKPRTW